MPADPCRHPRLVKFAILAGNVLDHYDTNLYAFLAPLLAPHFFPSHDPVVALLLAYSLMSSSLVTRPLGAFYFGRRACLAGPQSTLAASLMGLALSTSLLGLLPTYDQGGGWAPALLVLLRALQGFFAGGEQSVTGLFLMEKTSTPQRVMASAFYQSSTVLGILLASGVATACAFDEPTGVFWRLSFLAGGATGFFAALLRRKAEAPYSKIQLLPALPSFSLTRQRLAARLVVIGRIAVVAGLSYVTYALPFVFLNSFAGLVAGISYQDMMAWNTLFLVFDMLLCPLFARAVTTHDKARFMQKVALFLAVSAVVLFIKLPGASLAYFLLVRSWLTLLGLAFLAPMYAWFHDITDSRDRYLCKGLGYTIGTELMGRSCSFVCLALWRWTGQALAPALYIAFLCALTILGLRASALSAPPKICPQPQTQ